jgi:hypothetical protein
MRFILPVLVLMLASGCSEQTPPASKARFTDVVWKVASSPSVSPGSLYVFLSEGTLVITRAGDTPMTGSWTRNTDGLIMVEQGISYRTEILSLTADEFRIRSHNPGTPVDITLVRAE